MERLRDLQYIFGVTSGSPTVVDGMKKGFMAIFMIPKHDLTFFLLLILVKMYKSRERISFTIQKTKYFSFYVQEAMSNIYINMDKSSLTKSMNCVDPLGPQYRHSYSFAWYLYKMVTQNMMRTHEGKMVCSDKKYLICDYSGSNQMP